MVGLALGMLKELGRVTLPSNERQRLAHHKPALAFIRTAPVYFYLVSNSLDRNGELGRTHLNETIGEMKMKITANYLGVVAALLISTVFARSADFTVCQGIIGIAGVLVDKHDAQTWQQAVDFEFSKVCSDHSNYVSNLSAASKSTQAAFGYAGYSLGFGQSASDANARTQAAIDKVCSAGQSYVARYYGAVDRTKSGGPAASLIGDCLRILAQSGEEVFIGQTNGSTTSDASFTVDLRYEASHVTPGRRYKLVNIVVDSDADVKCTEGGTDVVNNLTITPGSQRAFECTKVKNKDVSGDFEFVADVGGQTRTLKFSVPSLSGHELIREQIKQEIETDIDTKIAKNLDPIKAATDELRATVDLQHSSQLVVGTGHNSVGDAVNGDRVAYCPSGTNLVGGFCDCSDITRALPGHYEQQGWYCRCGVVQPMGRQVAAAICRR